MFLRREAEPPHHRPLDLADHLAAGEAAQRVRLADQFRRGQRAEVEVPPPGRLILAPVPVEQVGQQRIDLVVPEFLEVVDLDVSIIDTRGIDQPSARADLEALLEDPHTVSILCSAFNDAPSQSIQHLLQRVRAINNTQIDSNTGVLVLARLR